MRTEIEKVKVTRTSFGARKLLLDFIQTSPEGSVHVWIEDDEKNLILGFFINEGQHAGLIYLIKIHDKTLTMPDFLKIIQSYPVANHEEIPAIRAWQENMSRLFDEEDVFTGENLLAINEALAPEEVTFGGIRVTEKRQRFKKQPLSARPRNRAINRKHAAYQRSCDMQDEIIRGMS